MIGFWIFLGGVVLYVVGSFLEWLGNKFKK